MNLVIKTPSKGRFYWRSRSGAEGGVSFEIDNSILDDCYVVGTHIHAHVYTSDAIRWINALKSVLEYDDIHEPSSLNQLHVTIRINLDTFDRLANIIADFTTGGGRYELDE